MCRRLSTDNEVFSAVAGATCPAGAKLARHVTPPLRLRPRTQVCTLGVSISCAFPSEAHLLRLPSFSPSEERNSGHVAGERTRPLQRSIPTGLTVPTVPACPSPATVVLIGCPAVPCGDTTKRNVLRCTTGPDEVCKVFSYFSDEPPQCFRRNSQISRMGSSRLLIHSSAISPADRTAPTLDLRGETPRKSAVAARTWLCSRLFSPEGLGGPAPCDKTRHRRPDGGALI